MRRSDAVVCVRVWATNLHSQTIGKDVIITKLVRDVVAIGCAEATLWAICGAHIRIPDLLRDLLRTVRAKAALCAVWRRKPAFSDHCKSFVRDLVRTVFAEATLAAPRERKPGFADR